MENSKSKICFVICPIGEEGSDIRKRSDQILKHIIAPTIKECGYSDSIRADQMSEPGNINTQVIQSIYDADLAIADLTGHNPNVFYELSFRHAIRKPVILIIKSGETVPFDISQDRVIYLDHNDLDSVEFCKKEIIKQVRSINDGNNQIDSPISTAIDIKLLRESKNQQEQWFATIIEMLEDIRSKLSRAHITIDKDVDLGASKKAFKGDWMQVLINVLERYEVDKDVETLRQAQALMDALKRTEEKL